MVALAVLPMSMKSQNNDKPGFLDKELRTLTLGYLESLLDGLQHAYSCEVRLSNGHLVPQGHAGEEQQANDAEWWQGDARLCCQGDEQA